MKPVRFPSGRGFTVAVAIAILTDLDTPSSRLCVERLRNGDYRGAVDMSFPDIGEDPLLFARNYLAYSLLRKIDWDIGVDKDAAAMGGFLKSEHTCAVVNSCGTMWSDLSPISKRSVGAIMSIAADLIQGLLGPFSWARASGHFAFTSGASTGHRRAASDPYFKFGHSVQATANAIPLVSSEIRLTPLWVEALHGQALCQRVDGSRVATVPKSWKTNRLICIEPEGNMRYQSAIGALIRRKLRFVGVDLNDQTTNRTRARTASITGHLSTIDLASASDSISLGLVHKLLPPDWCEAIELVRSPSTLLPDGSVVELEKVSSMGNGFTFELESLIFWALSSAVCRTLDIGVDDVYVYGDDIIVPSDAAPLLISVLSQLGFETNVDKTYTTGPFRESCGGHYYNGVDVTPFSIRTDITDEGRLYLLLNQYSEWCLRLFGEHRWGFARVLLESGRFLRRPCFVPDSYPDSSGLKSHTMPSEWRIPYKNGMWRFSAFLPVRRSFRPNGIPAILAWFSHHCGSDTAWVIEKGNTVYRRVPCRTHELR